MPYNESYGRSAGLLQPNHPSESSLSSYSLDDSHRPRLESDYPTLTNVSTPPIALPKTEIGQEDAEPVDMSIHSSEHETRTLYQLSHSLDFPKHPSHHQHHHHYHHTTQHQQRMMQKCNYRGKLAVHYLQGRQYSPSASVESPKYIDLDVNYGEACAERTSGHKRSVKANGIMMLDPNENVDQWNSSPIWSDALQRVPDVVHQDLSPYITTPTTPVDTPDSADLHSEVPVFNFDWTTEHHVPNSKIMVRRDLERQESRDHSQPITLHLPRRKNQTDASKDYGDK